MQKSEVPAQVDKLDRELQSLAQLAPLPVRLILAAAASRLVAILRALAS